MAVSDQAAAFAIERLESRHAEDVAPLSVEAGWNQIATDWRLMIELGRAFGVRAPSGQWIASALLLPLGPAIAWISMVLVTAPARRQGLGTRLLARCLHEAEQAGVATGLDATEFGRPVYLPLGFRDVYPLSRWRLEAGSHGRIAPPAGIRLRPAKAADLSRIAAFDQAHSGFARKPILAHLLARVPALAHVAERADGQLAGYVLGRDGHAATHIGPLVAADEAVALALLTGAVDAAGSRVILDMPDCHRGMAAWLTAHGGTAPRAFMRMLGMRTLGASTPSIEDPARVFALAGPELA